MEESFIELPIQCEVCGEEDLHEFYFKGAGNKSTDVYYEHLPYEKKECSACGETYQIKAELEIGVEYKYD